MKILNWVLVLLLSVSVGLNGYLLMGNNDLAQSSNQVPAEPSATSVPTSAKTSPKSSPTSARTPENALILPNSDITQSDKQTLLDKAREALAAGRIIQVSDFVQRYLRANPRDIEFLLLEGDIIARTQPINYALAQYYQLLDLPLNDTQRSELLATIEQLTSENIRKLKQVRSWDILATFLEPLWQFDPTNRRYILNLAEAYARQQLASLMENVLASMLQDDPDAVRIRNLIQYAQDDTPSPVQITEPQAYDRAIALARYGDHFIVETRLNNRQFNLMIDTGASTTVLTQKAFGQMRRTRSTQYIGNYLVNTAGGQVEAPIYKLSNMSIADYQVQDVAVVVLPMEDFTQAEGLLGMNFLREFEFRIDQNDGLLYLKQ